MSASLLIDHVTGGPTEYQFQLLFEQRLSQQDVPCALLYCNVKHFSSVNTMYGREAGDRVLQTIYNTFLEHLQPNEVLSRIYTDVFLLLLNASSAEALTARIFQLDDAICYEQELQEIHRIFFSIGGYIITDPNDSYAHAVDCANYSRTNSCDRDDENTSYDIYGYTIQDTRERALALLKRSHHALRSGQFEIYLQPKYELERETVAGAEALIRWRDPEEGMIPLCDFMPPFEKSGFIRKIDHFVFDSVLRLLQRRLDADQSVVPISLNLSKSHFTSYTFFEDHFLPIFERYHVPASLIEFEISESLMIEDQEQIRHLIELLQEYGFGCSLDDFGSGYSCLNTIKTIPISTLKLDQKMFTEEAKERGKVVIRGILQIARGLDMNVVSEGVETREYVDFLKENHAGLVQGFYFSRPLPVADFEALLP